MEDEEETVSVEQKSFDDALDKLLESKKKSKVASLEQIFNILKDKFQLVDYDTNRETLCDGIKRSLTSSNESERSLGCKVLSAYGLLLGTECSTILPMFSPILNQMVTRESGATLVSAVNALSILLFVGGEEKETLTFLEKLSSFFTKTNISDLVLQNILNCWCFLLTVISNSGNAPIVSSEILPMQLDHLAEILKSSRSYETKIVAGFGVALLVYFQQQHDESNETQFNIYELDGYTSIPDLLDIIDLLSREKDRSINVQNQKSLKKSFRQINASLKDGSAPSEELKMVNTVIEFKTWPQLIQLNFFRDFLNNGLYSHMRYNDLFAEIFEYDIALDKQISDRTTDVEKSRMRKEKQKFVSKKLHKLSSTNLRARNDNAAFE